MKQVATFLLLASMAGCSADHLYKVLGSPDPMGPLVRYPLDYPVCYNRPGSGTIYVPLRIRVMSAGIPDPMQLMSLRKKNPTDDGCFYTKRNKAPPRPSVVMRDSEFELSASGWQSLDMTGRGYFSAVAYKQALLNADDLRKEAEHEQQVAQYRVQNLEKFGETNVDVVKQDEAIVINGLKWRHRLVAHYITPDLENPSVGRLTGWRDIYEHQVDGTHVLRRIGRYDAMVVSDPEWITSRRELTRKLVEAVRIERVTQTEVDAAVAEHARRRAIDKKCGVDMKCRARAVEDF